MNQKRPPAPTHADIENARLHRIAARHGLPAEGFEHLVTQSRAIARERRRRLSDDQLDDLIQQMGRRG